MSTELATTSQPAGPDFNDIDRGDTITADNPPRCHDDTMRHLNTSPFGHWQCWHCECEIYTDTQGVVTETPYDACDDH